MEKRTSPVKEEERDVPASAAGDTAGGGILKFGHKSRVADRDFAKPTSPAGDQSDSRNKTQEEEELKSTRAEVGEAREENERLKKVLTRIVKDYQALQMHFFDIVQQQDQPPPPPAAAAAKRRPIDDDDDEVELEPELVSLRLGTSTSTSAEVHEAKESEKRGKEEDVGGSGGDGDDIEGLSLGLDSKFGRNPVSRVAAAVEPPPGLSSDNSSEEAKEQEPAGEPWPPGKAAKNPRSAAGEEEATPQAQVKRARVSVRARCDTPTMNDGCQWRKYGQKVSKGNPCPRAYYRCTVAPLCPVRKQVQRCAEDMSILITTYEGTHNHPLPISATAMASTTSAAACMLTSGSSAPRLSGLISAPSSSSYNNNLHGPGHFYLQNQLISPASSNSHPTITLDLTNKYNSSSNFAPRCPPAPAPTTTFNFSSSIDSNSMPSWTTTSQPFNNKTTTASTSHMYSSLMNQAYWQRAATSSLPPPAPPNSSNMSTDTIARAITSDPSFQSALAAAITSYVGARDAGHGPPRHSINRTASLGSGRQGGLQALLQQPVPVAAPGPKSASGSPVDDMELQAD